MKIFSSTSVFLVILFAFLHFTAKAQWNTNTFENLLISGLHTSDMQTVSTNDGKLWVAFYHQNFGNYDMRAQLFDASGNKLLGEQGVLVSNKTSGSATFVFNVAVDDAGNLIVANQDQRTGSSYKAVLYKLSQQGNHLWPVDGVVVGDGLAPYPAVLSNGEVVVAWSDSPSNTVQVQKINTQGSVVWPNSVPILVGTANTTRGQIVANSDGKFTIVFQRLLAGISTYLYAQQFNSDGAYMYEPVQLSNLSTSAARYYDVVAAANITYIGYYAASGNRFNSYLQRINANGSLPYGINGTNFNTSTGPNDNYQQTTTIGIEPDSPYVWAVCSFSNPNQSMNGLYVQKFLKTTGARQFTDMGKMIYPVDNMRNTPAGSVLLDNDVPIIMLYDVDYKIYVTKLDQNGEFVWPYQRAEVSSTTQSLADPKGRFGFNWVGEHNMAATWTENRGVSNTGYIQGISVGGLFDVEVETAGGVPAEINTNGGTLQLQAAVYPDYANQQVEWSIIPETGDASISIDGLVTALSNGTVWAKAVAFQDNTVNDSILISISGQAVLPPIVTTLAADNIESFSATLHGLVNANTGTATAYFEYGLTEAYGNQINAVPFEVSGDEEIAVLAELIELLPGNEYQFRLVATNSHGTTYGENLSFTTEQAVYLADQNKPKAFDIFPNPNQGEFEMKINQILGENVLIEIYNHLGILIYSQTIAIMDEAHHVRISLDRPSPSLCVVLLKSNNQLYHSKLLIK